MARRATVGVSSLLLLLLALSSSLPAATAFLVTPSAPAAAAARATATRMQAERPPQQGGGAGDMDRRALVRNAGVGLSVLSGLALLQLPNNEGRLVSPASASVAFDPDRYGDKELKIATVNKLKQKLRNAIAGDLSLAVPFLRIAINDGVGYDAATQDGGPDGSIAFEMDRPQNEGLKPALATLIKIKQEVQATNEITFADIVAFAGAVAIECVGGPRIPVQLGRTDSGEPNKANAGGAGYGWGGLTGEGIVSTLGKAGFGPREGVLLYGAVGAVHLATKDAGKSAGEEDADIDDDGEEEPFIPTTFGRQQDIYGAQIGTRKFDASYLAKALKGEATGLPQLDKALTSSETGLKNFAQKYAGNNGAFTKDLSECYLKLTTLGFTGTTRNS